MAPRIFYSSRGSVLEEWDCASRWHLPFLFVAVTLAPLVQVSILVAEYPAVTVPVLVFFTLETDQSHYRFLSLRRQLATHFSHVT